MGVQKIRPAQFFYRFPSRSAPSALRRCCVRALLNHLSACGARAGEPPPYNAPPLAPVLFISRNTLAASVEPVAFRWGCPAASSRFLRGWSSCPHGVQDFSDRGPWIPWRDSIVATSASHMPLSPPSSVSSEGRYCRSVRGDRRAAVADPERADHPYHRRLRLGATASTADLIRPAAGLLSMSRPISLPCRRVRSCARGAGPAPQVRVGSDAAIVMANGLGCLTIPCMDVCPQ